MSVRYTSTPVICFQDSFVMSYDVVGQSISSAMASGLRLSDRGHQSNLLSSSAGPLGLRSGGRRRREGGSAPHLKLGTAYRFPHRGPGVAGRMLAPARAGAIWLGRQC